MPRTRKRYKGGEPPETWMVYDPQPIAGRMGDYRINRNNILEEIEGSEDANACIKLFSGLSYNLLEGVFNYWSKLKKKKDIGQLDEYIKNIELMKILDYVDLNNFPDDFETFVCYKFLMQNQEKGSCIDPGKVFEVGVFPPEATTDFYLNSQAPFPINKGPEYLRNVWVKTQVENILLGNSSNEIGNTREVFYLLNELFHSDCPNNKGDYYEKRYSVMNIFWSIIWCRAIINSHENEGYTTSNEHIIDINNTLFNKRVQINISEIDERINMLVTIYGAKNIFQIIRIPDGDYNAKNFKPVSKVTSKEDSYRGAKLAIIPGDFESKMNVCHMGRPKVVPHIALTSILKPAYRAVPVGVPMIVTGKDGRPVIKQSNEVYVDQIKGLQKELRNVRELNDTDGQSDVIKKFGNLGTFKDKNGLEWVSCIAPCVCMTTDKGVTQTCSVNGGSCNNTGKYLTIPNKEKINRPSVQNVKNPPLSNRELKYLFSDKIQTFKQNRKSHNKITPPTNEEIRRKFRYTEVPWEIGQWFIRINPKSIGYKIAQQNQTLVITGISNHARLIMDFLSIFIPFTDFNNKKLLTARLVSSLIQPIHHTSNEVLKSVEYLGINYDPSIPEEESIARLLTVENEDKIRKFKKLFGSISYQTIVPYLKQEQYDELYRKTGDLGVMGQVLGFDSEVKNFSNDYIYPYVKQVYPDGLRKRNVSSKGGKTKKRKYRKRKTRKRPT